MGLSDLLKGLDTVSTLVQLGIETLCFMEMIIRCGTQYILNTSTMKQTIDKDEDSSKKDSWDQLGNNDALCPSAFTLAATSNISG